MLVADSSALLLVNFPVGTLALLLAVVRRLVASRTRADGRRLAALCTRALELPKELGLAPSFDIAISFDIHGVFFTG